MERTQLRGVAKRWGVRRLSRRAALGGFGGGAAALLGVGRRRKTMAAGPLVGQSGFVGAWRVTFVIEGRPAASSLTSFTSDGIILSTNQPALTTPSAPDGVILQSTGQGTWVATSERTIDITFIILQSDAEGADLGTRTIRGTLALGESGETWSGSYTATVADAAGNVERTSAGQVQAVRIAVEPVAPSGTPQPTPDPDHSRRSESDQFDTLMELRQHNSAESYSAEYDRKGPTKATPAKLRVARLTDHRVQRGTA